MRLPHDTRACARAALLAVLAVGGCKLPLVDVGNPPRGPVREYETAASRAKRAQLEEERHRRLDEAEEQAVSGGRPAPSDEAVRYAVEATHRYHVAGCEDLESVPAAQRVPYPTCWDAINANLSPCPKCRPGP
jgi:hypothetical protein